MTFHSPWSLYTARVWLFSLAPLATFGGACSPPSPDNTPPPPSGGSSGAGMMTGGGAGLGPGSGGMAASGGPALNGGAPGSGGSAGSAAAPPSTGGSAGLATGGSAGAPAAGTGGTASSSCVFTVTPKLSEVIESVGVIDWTVDRTALTSASIEFGLDTSYGMTAPVDLTEPNYRTLLLGMKYGREYHYRIVAKTATETCTSGDYTIETALLPNGLPTPVVTTPQPTKTQGGFAITARWGMGTKGPSFILDQDSDFVWVLDAKDDVIRTRMSFDGKYMWIRNTAQVDGTGVVRRVRMDGTDEKEFSLPKTTHDLAVIPDGHLGLIGHATDGCDEILDFNPEDGSLVSLFNAQDAHGGSMCHVNYLAYFEGDKSFVFSDFQTSTLVKITRTGELVWVLNGMGSTISGTDWAHQHGVHVLSPDRLLVFSNGDNSQESLALEFKLDLTAMTAMETWRYEGHFETGFGGDIQRLPNGNTLVTYSSSGVIHEVDPQQMLVQEHQWGIGNTVSYTEKRPTLYGGPPPKIYE
jgi:hypothetical protein